MMRAGFALDTRVGVFSTRLTHATKMRFLETPPFIRVWDVALLYGVVPLRWLSTSLPLLLSAGVAYTRTVRRGEESNCGTFSCDYEWFEGSTVGLPLEARVATNVYGPLRLGASLFANLNGEHSYLGFSVDLILWGSQND